MWTSPYNTVTMEEHSVSGDNTKFITTTLRELMLISLEVTLRYIQKVLLKWKKKDTQNDLMLPPPEYL